MHHSISLINGVLMNTIHPTTFAIPTMDEKAAVVEGNYVKLGFQTNGGPNNGITERMWVLVTGPGKGILNNDPVLTPIRCDDPVEFELFNILAIMK